MCQAKELCISFSLSFFEKNEKANLLYRLRQLTIAKKMKRCVPLRQNVAEKPRGMSLKLVLSLLRTCTHEVKTYVRFLQELSKSQSSPTP